MAFSKKKLDRQVQEWLRKVAAEGRALLAYVAHLVGVTIRIPGEF